MKLKLNCFVLFLFIQILQFSIHYKILLHFQPADLMFSAILPHLASTISKIFIFNTICPHLFIVLTRHYYFKFRKNLTYLNLISLLAPLLKPPMSLSNSLLPQKWVLKANKFDQALSFLMASFSLSVSTSVRATTVAFFWWTRLPRADFPLTKQYGMSSFLLLEISSPRDPSYIEIERALSILVLKYLRSKGQ